MSAPHWLAQLTRLGHQAYIANSRGPETLTDVAAQNGATPVPITDVTSKADIVVVAIPEKSITELPAGLFSEIGSEVVVIDAGNYVPKLRDGRIEAIEAGLPESEWVQSQLRHLVVKAFNTIRRCLALSLRHWEIGQHGAWGGLVAAERAALRRRMNANVTREVGRRERR